MKNYSRSVSIALASLMLDSNLSIKVKQQVIDDLRELEERAQQDDELSELVYPTGTEI